jgi:hypothetical protein
MVSHSVSLKTHDGSVVVVVTVVVVVVVQVPQLRVPPQPSGIVPQVAPWAAHVVRVQHTPKGFEPGGAPLTHAPLQQL